MSSKIQPFNNQPTGLSIVSVIVVTVAVITVVVVVVVSVIVIVVVSVVAVAVVIVVVIGVSGLVVKTCFHYGCTALRCALRAIVSDM